MSETAPTGAFRTAVITVAALNLAYGLVEMGVALRIGSVSLFADSIDFFKDGAVNILIAFALGWSATNRARVGVALAAVLFYPAAATLWVAVQKVLDPVAPVAASLGLAALGALLVNLVSAVLLARHRHEQGSVAVAAWMSAHNDAFGLFGSLSSVGVIQMKLLLQSCNSVRRGRLAQPTCRP